MMILDSLEAALIVRTFDLPTGSTTFNNVKNSIIPIKLLTS